MHNLESISFADSNIRASHLAALSEAGKGRIKRLSLHRCFCLPAGVLHTIAKTFPELRELRVSSLTLSEASLTTAEEGAMAGRPRTAAARLPHFSSLRHLAMINCKVDASGRPVATAAALLAAAPDLETLSLAGLECEPDAFYAPLPPPGDEDGPALDDGAPSFGRALWLLECRFADYPTDENAAWAPQARRREAPAEGPGRGGPADAVRHALGIEPPSAAAAAGPASAEAPPGPGTAFGSAAEAFLASVAARLPACSAPVALAAGIDASAGLAMALSRPAYSRPWRLRQLADVLAFAAAGRSRGAQLTGLVAACKDGDPATVTAELLMGADPLQNSARRTSAAGTACEHGMVRPLCALLGVGEEEAAAMASAAQDEASALLDTAGSAGHGREPETLTDLVDAPAAGPAAAAASGAGVPVAAPPADPTAAAAAVGPSPRGPARLAAAELLARARGQDPVGVLARAQRRARTSLVIQNLRNENPRHIASIRGHPACLAAVLCAERRLAEEVGPDGNGLPHAAVAAATTARAAPVGGPASARAVLESADSAAAAVAAAKRPGGAGAASVASAAGASERGPAASREDVPAAVLRVASTSFNGWTPLHAAGVWGDTTVMRLLLRTGTEDLEAQNRYGQTPLHVAAWSRNAMRACGLLLLAGASPLAMDDGGSLPWREARERGAAADIVEMLRAAAVEAASDEAERAVAERGTAAASPPGKKKRRRKRGPVASRA